MNIITQKEKEERVYNAFNEFLKEGKSKTQATYACMRLFNYATPAAIYQIRKRVEERL